MLAAEVKSLTKHSLSTWYSLFLCQSLMQISMCELPHTELPHQNRQAVRQQPTTSSLIFCPHV